MMRMVREVYFARFSLFFTCILFVMLSLLYYNVGLGLRQRAMAFPALFSLFVAQYLVQRQRAQSISRDIGRAHGDTAAILVAQRILTR